MIVFVFLFFKQKTAYELRISDWSSDVCSSDLLGSDVSGFGVAVRLRPEEESPSSLSAIFVTFLNKPGHISIVIQRQHVGEEARAIFGEDIIRSEEHTSELQSLMRISYDVFCLKKKKNKNLK